MVQDSSSAYRIPQYLYEKQNIFFIKFIEQQDEGCYYNYISNKDNVNANILSDKTIQLKNQKNYSLNKTLTTNQLLKSQTIKQIPLKNKQVNENWYSLSILACLLLFSITKVFYNKRLGQLFSALFANRILSQINREGNFKKEGISILLFLFFLISTSLFIYKASVFYFDFNWFGIKSSITIFFIIIFIILILYYVKIQLIRFIGYVFNTQTETNEYLLYYLLNLLVFGTILIIPIIIQSYVSYKVGFFIAVGFFLLSEGYRIINSVISLFSSSKFSVLFIFLYLCTVEIIPVMIIYKVLLNFIKT